ncbi:MAG: MotA/TolQ/ExbB proton channel family protein [Lentisphaeria bacterium]|nr:MotA/TolQ/ExbB proton channel family protein [Lentisphaeria bacterium]
MSTLITLRTRTAAFAALCATSGRLFAQEAAATAEAAAGGPSFWNVIYGGHLVNLLIWVLIALTSFAALWLIIDGVISIKRDKLLPAHVVDGVRDALTNGDLGVALETCEANPSPISTILMAGFSNISEGYEVIQEAVASSAEMESEKVMQRVNYLNLCGQIAPMLGLMGTVVGMVYAFGTLATATGAAKAQLLAQNISTALWTTCVGLLVSVPALLAFTLIRNYATRLILESEATVLDLIKVLRNAEIEEE